MLATTHCTHSTDSVLSAGCPPLQQTISIFSSTTSITKFVITLRVSESYKRANNNWVEMLGHCSLTFNKLSDHRVCLWRVRPTVKGNCVCRKRNWSLDSFQCQSSSAETRGKGYHFLLITGYYRANASQHQWRAMKSTITITTCPTITYYCKPFWLIAK